MSKPDFDFNNMTNEDWDRYMESIGAIPMTPEESQRAKDMGWWECGDKTTSCSPTAEASDLKSAQSRFKSEQEEYAIKQEGLRQARIYAAECGCTGHYQETAILAAYMAGYCNAMLAV